ncbi:sulfurtransferase complex subunit TusD [Alteromonadaceae bacterium BrNp21-10]|nr:sulfurtransferase complex subunit TusD [Alteromonadaceae bacterium BrNp21-10]
MTTFSLFITSAPFDSASAYTAFKFAESVNALGHQLNGVFFYQSGVVTANSFTQVAADEVNLHDKWQHLSEQHNIPLYVCVTAANRRGIVNQTDAQDNDSEYFNLAEPFQEVGLGELVELSNNSDRLVQF